MDYINKFTGGSNSQNTAQNPQAQQQQPQTKSSGGFMDKLHGMAGGGPESEKKEDALDKGIDWVQENVLGQGQQSNENAAEQAKDRLIASQIRQQYKNATGQEMPLGKQQEAVEKQKKTGSFGGLF
ncbi:hypothetical protein N0V88_002804 [Collariella sp. IMI 366227]|nr:hypothetical protein N0V88_002804 [Collariella sp. IMI 366227]